MWLILSASSVHCGSSAGISEHEPNQSLHSDATALCHLLLRALWISVPHPKSTLAVPPVSSNVRRLIEGFTSIRRVWGSRILSATHLDRGASEFAVSLPGC